MCAKLYTRVHESCKQHRISLEVYIAARAEAVLAIYYDASDSCLELLHFRWTQKRNIHVSANGSWIITRKRVKEAKSPS
jgi:hypothetical protein